ncbi:hypothetical protein [Intrasporangium sp.]|uniref:AtpZ/AtpI family protein n=1 Tax=Intrasporangium sp. TaxID=1925024 RepID=UPI003221B36E
MSTPQPEPSSPRDEQAAAEEQRSVNVRAADSAWRVFAYLLSGPLTYGGIGWLVDRWLGTSWIVGVGIVGGMAVSIYYIWFRYGTH